MPDVRCTMHEAAVPQSRDQENQELSPNARYTSFVEPRWATQTVRNTINPQSTGLVQSGSVWQSSPLVTQRAIDNR
ncbi:hypothetical protein N7462_010594 [Penicillium macrosclerotiorum]|uniref:uncharacterized protein n=1 Tax=Penicillium macrosclerotiorum TaxID=303699 RepID=UPI002547C8AE|nr:uncharacterized protein N7462_010594 [Penicillium macrosclerotiorum]KAJ5669524.1 hypothetical protein N7462_010594 [Penicillium macrosclerotiorum]